MTMELHIYDLIGFWTPLYQKYSVQMLWNLEIKID